jgi:hypothetical protein
MTTETQPYAYRKHLTAAGLLALLALSTAALYEWRSTPYTMVVFLMAGSTVLLIAMVLFGWIIWKEVRARLDSIITRSFAPGDAIYRQGDPADHIFIITQGQVDILHVDPTGSETLLGRLGANDYFGETAILSRLPRQAAPAL